MKGKVLILKQKGKEKLNAMGYMEVNRFLDERIIVRQSAIDGLNGYIRFLNMNQYFDASCAFHQPGGDGYKLVLNCLQKYLDFKFIRENNTFRFDESLFDERVSFVIDEQMGELDYVIHDQPMHYRAGYDGTRADIYFLLNEADQNGIATRRCMNYMNSNRLHLTAILVQLIERIVDNLEKDVTKKHQDYARIIKTAYMTPEYADCDVYALFDVIGCSKKQYYRLRNAAISLLSETLFGIFAGENGFAELYIGNNEIRIPALMK